jgi:pyrroline-5-carboxylate reductase
MKTVGIIGGGNMGSAIISRINKTFKVIVSEQDEKRAAELKRKFKVALKDIPELVAASNAILIAVKPQDIDAVLLAIKKAGGKEKLIISIAAGITTAYLEKYLGKETRVVRTMPNMPAMIGEGMTAVAEGKYTKVSDIKFALEIFDNIGKTVVVGEQWIDAITAVSGSGPAYVFLFAECLIKAAVALGLDEKDSQALVKQTLLGSIHLLDKSKDDAATLRAKVTSKGGTTQAAMDVLMGLNIEKIFQDALIAARNRARELSIK